MKWAKEAGLTGKSYVWIATQSVIGESKEALPDFPAGMLGEMIFTFLDPWPCMTWNPPINPPHPSPCHNNYFVQNL